MTGRSLVMEKAALCGSAYLEYAGMLCIKPHMAPMAKPIETKVKFFATLDQGRKFVCFHARKQNIGTSKNGTISPRHNSVSRQYSPECFGRKAESLLKQQLKRRAMQLAIIQKIELKAILKAKPQME